MPGSMKGIDNEVSYDADFWPKLSEHTKEEIIPPPDIVETKSDRSDDPPSSEGDWEFVASDTDTDEKKESEPSLEVVHDLPVSPHNKTKEQTSPMILHRCLSTPVFTDTSQDASEDSSYIMDCSSSSVSARSILTDMPQNDTVLLSKVESQNTMKKVPSFKDIILLKAKEQEKEEMNKRIQVKLREEKSRQDMLKRKKAMKPKLVLSPITRCSKSTGDLRSLVCINEDEDICDFNGCKSTINEDEEQILGETDAMEFYHQKSRGRSNRSNGMKIRPDEAKRKKMIIDKKNMQRRSQRGS